MKLRWVLPLVWVAVLFGTIGVAQATGGWEVSGRQEVVNGTLAPADLKGWMTVQQAADGLGVPVSVVIGAIGDPAGVVTPAMAFKDVEAVVPGFSLDVLRDTLTAQLGGASAAPSASPPPTSAPSASAVPSAAASSVAPTPHPSGTGTGAGQAGVTGQQTLRQVSEVAGIPLDVLIAESGLPADVNPDVALRTLKDTIPGFEMQQVRDAVERLS